MCSIYVGGLVIVNLWTAVLFLCDFFFFNDTATTEIYTLSLHDALPIYDGISWTTNMEEDFKLRKNTKQQLIVHLIQAFFFIYDI